MSNTPHDWPDVNNSALYNMKKKCTLLCLILLQTCFLIHGQKGYKPGYIITNGFDTLRGSIKLKTNIENSEACEFIEGGIQMPKVYKPDDIRAYRIENSKYYVSKEVVIDSAKQKIFLEFLVKGIANLFYYKGQGKEYYFIEKDNVMTQLSNDVSMVTVKSMGVMGEYEETYSKNSNQYKRMLQYLFQQSPEVLKEIPNTLFDYRPLIKITKDYHNSVCKDNNCIDFTKSTKKSLYLEPYIGVIDSWMKLNTSKDKIQDIKPYIGLQLRLTPFKGYSMWNFLAGINFSSDKFEGVFSNSLNQWNLPYRVYTKYSILRVPLKIEYNLPVEKIQPFFSMGFGTIALLNSEYKVFRINGNTEDPEKSYMRRFQYSLSLGFGLRYKLSNDLYLYLKNEFEYRIPGANFGYILDQTKVYSDMINFGLGFKIK